MSADNDHDETEDLRSPREKASKIPSWIMVGFILGGITFYSINDYLGNRGRQPPRPAAAATGTLATTSTTAGQPPAAPPAPSVRLTLDTTTKASPLLDNSRQMTLFAIDAIFREWMVNAMWEYDTTQIVLWNPADGQYSTTVEVYRLGTEAAGYDYFYRRIPRPTRPLIHDPSRPDALIIFTESEEATARRKEKQNEFWRR